MQKAYFFNNGNYLRFDIPSDKVDIDPTQLNQHSWDGFPKSWKKVDAAVNWGNGKIYMFNGRAYTRFDILQDKFDQDLRPILGNWDGFPLTWLKVDAAVNWGNGKVYMFNDDSYIRYDILLDKVDQEIRPIKGNWHGFPDTWNKVDAVLNWGDGRVYMFNGDEYLRFSVPADKVDRKPRSIKDFGKNFPNNWSKIDDGVIIDNTAEKMGSQIEQSIKNETVGFAYVIYDNLRLVKSGYGGLRAKAQDSAHLVANPFSIPTPLPFSINTQMGIGSITKSMTTMALLNCLMDNQKKEAGKALQKVNVGVTIDKYLPQSWSPQGAKVSTISFQQLLTHSSGIQPNGDDYATLKSIIQMGVGSKKPIYANPNFSLMRVLIPSINGISLTGNDDAADAQAVADAYKQYMRKKVFEPSGVHNADCRLNSEEYALLYGPPSDTSGAYPYDGDDDSTLSAGAGGWKLSALELGKVINTFFTTERILPETIRKQMIEETLGCYQEPKSICVTATHNGSWGKGKGYHNCYYIFNDGIQCVLMTNSTYAQSPTDPETVVKAAHKATFGCYAK